MTTAFDYTSPDVVRDPSAHLSRLREQGPVHCTRMRSGLEIWWVTRYEDARAALVDPRLSHEPAAFRAALERVGLLLDGPHAAAGPRELLTSDPPEHERLRGVVRRAFAPAGVERQRARVEQHAEQLLDAIGARGEVELVHELAFPLIERLTFDLIGFSDRAAALAAPLWSAQIGEWSRHLLAALDATRPHVDLAVPAAEQPTAIGALIAACDREGRLTEAEAVQVLQSVVEGRGTASRKIAEAVYLLLREPGQLRLLREQPELIRPAFEELLRHVCDLGLSVGRVTREDVEIAGKTIPAGRLVQIVLDAANRDPRRFPDPDRLDIARGEERHLSFGRGIHFCLGAALVRLVGQVLVAAVLRRLPDLELACAPAELQWHAEAAEERYLLSTTLERALLRLPVQFTPIT